jgi:arabinose-5-phosphate isomerase
MDPGLLSRRVGEIMTRDPRTIGPDALADEALRAMNAPERRVTTLFVVNQKGVPEGILHVHDLLRVGQV